jgi:hypothetical protein
MAILLNDNLDVAAVKPTDNRYGPHDTLVAAKAAISPTRRYIGLTVGIVTGGTVDEYWFKSGILDVDLVAKEIVSTAGATVNTPAGNIVATDVQAAINELDTEKVAKAGDTMTGALNLPSNGLVVGTTQLVVSGGNVGIGTTLAPAYKLEVNGSFAATTKSFVIDHPTNSDMKLRYGSLEGPENGVYVRGRCRGNFIELPDYWTKLVDPLSITVSLTAIGKYQSLCVLNIEHNVVTIANENVLDQHVDCFYVVYGERADVAKLVVEIDK